jgi:hypothetical protein
MDDAPTTKQDILERNRRAADAIDRVLAELTDEQFLAVPAGGGWSARDVLAHLGADVRWMSAQLAAALEGRAPTELEAFGTEDPPPAGADLSTQDGRNAAQHERYRHLPLDEVRATWARYRDHIAGLIERIPDDQFAVSHTFAPLGHLGHVRPAAEGEEGWPLWRWLAGNTWYHFEDHLADFEAARGR